MLKDDNNEDQRSSVICPGSHTSKGAEPRPKLRSLDSTSDDLPAYRSPNKCCRKCLKGVYTVTVL